MFATCLGCGCACDDIQLRVEADRIREARNACSLGQEWFGDGSVSSRIVVGGRDASLDDALDVAVDVLGRAARPLVYLAPDISCEAQRAAIGLADILHATVDSVTSGTIRGAVLAAQELGRASATLGEIRNRADVVVFWGVDPSQKYPRFWTRYAPEPTGLHVGGRRDRIVLAVDVGSARGPEDADDRFAVMPDREVSVLEELTAGAVHPDSGSPVPRLLGRILEGRYVALIADGEPETGGGGHPDGRSAALLTLAQALNGPARCAYVALRAGGNRSGADACLTSQTGYPLAVDFSRGHPRYRPHEHAAARLERGSVDAVVIVGSVGLIPFPATRLADVSTIVIGPRATEARFTVSAAVDTAVAGIHESGTALRMDDVPLPLMAAVRGPRAAVDVVLDLARRLASAR
jgi:formylmethanofuran dehydrogenase subunit B